MHRLILRPAAALALCIGTLLPGLALGLQVSAVCNGNVRLDGDGAGNPVWGENYGPTPALCVAQADDATPAGGADGHVTSSGHASPAILQASVNTQGAVSLNGRPQIDYTEVRAIGYAEVEVVDSFAVTSSQVSPGSLLSVTLGFFVHGAVTGAGSNAFHADSRNWYTSFLVQGNQSLAQTSGEQLIQLGTRDIVGTPGYRETTSDGQTFDGLHEMTLSLVVGSSVDLYMKAKASAGTFALIGRGDPLLGSSAVASADMGHSLTWAGISAVRGPDGSLLSGYNALSASSGFDYANAYVAVPESSTVAMLLAGIAGTGVVARRRVARSVRGASSLR